MPYTVIIVEDESVLRASFIRHVNWISCGFTVVYDCISAEEAVGYMDKNGFPDLLFTDIRLFKMSGIDLCHYVQIHSPHTRKLLLTGYSDFEYAKQAISYHVDEYLLKPIEPTEIEKLLLTYAKQLQAIKASDEIRQMANSNRERYIENVLSELVCGAVFHSDKEDDLIDSELSQMFQTPYVCVCIKYFFHQDAGQRPPNGFMLQEFFRKEFASDCDHFFFCVEHRRLAGFLLRQDAVWVTKRLHDALTHCAQHNAQVVLSAGISLPQIGISCVKEAYEQASIACSCAVSVGSGCVVNFPEATSEIHTQGTTLHLWNEQIAALLSTGDWKKVIVLLQKQLEIIKSKQNSTLEAVQRACVDLITRIYHEIMPSDRDDITHMLSVDILSLMAAISIDDINRSLEKILQHCEQIMQENHVQNFYNTIDIITSYLQKNYAQNISLEDLSRVVYLNPRYICALVKRNTNKTFYEILTEIRIKKACELLKNPTMKIYEISNMVGFRDTKLFNKAFKRVTTQTPSQYRQELHELK